MNWKDFIKFKNKDKVIILGSGPTWGSAPFDATDCEFWCLNAFHRNMEENDLNPELADRWFQIHKPGSNEGHIDDADHIQWLGRRKAPVYMIKEYEMVPGSVPFPLDEVSKELGPMGGEPLFTNSVDFMITLAIVERFSEIGIYGIDFISPTDNEFSDMRYSFCYYCGKAEGLGIKLVLPDESSLLRSNRIYGFDPQPHEINNMIRRFRKYRTDIAGQVEQIDTRKEALLRDKYRAEGAMKTLDQVVFELRLKKDCGAPI